MSESLRPLLENNERLKIWNDATFVANQHMVGAMRVLTEEIERLKAGRFTKEEFQNLCHNLTPDDLCRFRKGCEAYQRKLFGDAAVDEAIMQEFCDTPVKNVTVGEYLTGQAVTLIGPTREVQP